MVRRRFLPLACAFAAGLLVMGGVAWGANPFVDIAGNSHAADIDAIYNAGITLGCTDATHYCPTQAVTRDQIASFLARTAALSSGATKHFPVANGRGQTQVYCALAAANPGSYKAGACQSGFVTVDGSGDSVGLFTSVAIGIDGLPIISYFDSSNLDLKVAHCATIACTGASTITAVDSATVGNFTSIAIGTDGFAVISYWDATNLDLRVAHCNDVACTGTPTITTVDMAGDVGRWTSIAIGTDGFPVISYYDTVAGLKVAKCANTACTGASSVTTLDAVGSIGSSTSIAISTDSLPVISYYDGNAGDLKVAHCINVACTGVPTITTLDSAADVGEYSSIIISTDGLPVISYWDNSTDDLKVAHCINEGCTGIPTITALDTAGSVGRNTSIAIGTDGLPIISYYSDTSQNLKMAHCTNVACTGTPAITTLDTAGNVGQYTSIAIGTDGVPVISYFDASSSDLKVARPPVT